MKNTIIMNDFDIAEGVIWFVHSIYNCIMKYDINEDKIYYVAYIPEEYKGRYTYKSIFIYENKIVIIPDQSNIIVIYDIYKKEFSRLEVSEEKHKYGFFRLNVRVNSFIYLVPSQYDYICKYDIDNNKLEKIFNWKTIKKEYSQDSYICDATFLKNEYIAFIVKPQNEIIIVSLKNTEDYYVFKEIDGVNYTTLCLIDNYIYVRDEANKVITKIDCKLKKIVNKKEENINEPYYMYSYDDKYMIIDFITQPTMIIMDTDFNKVYEYTAINELEEEYCYLVYTDKMKHKNESVWFSNASSEFVFINNEHREKRKKLYIIKGNEQLRKNVMLNSSMLVENEYIKLEDLIHVCIN